MHITVARRATVICIIPLKKVLSPWVVGVNFRANSRGKSFFQNGPRFPQNGCNTFFSLIFILAGRSEMRTFYLELLKNFKFEVGHKNVSIYFSLDTWRWKHKLKNILTCRVRSIKIFSNVSHFIYLFFKRPALQGSPYELHFTWMLGRIHSNNK